MSMPEHPDAPAALVARLREVCIRADSYLSLLWHRGVPPDRKDPQLTRDVEVTISELRATYEGRNAPSLFQQLEAALAALGVPSQEKVQNEDDQSRVDGVPEGAHGDLPQRPTR